MTLVGVSGSVCFSSNVCGLRELPGHRLPMVYGGRPCLVLFWSCGVAVRDPAWK